MKTNLEKNGFVTITYPKELRRVVETSVSHWKRFCDLDSHIKNTVEYSSFSDGVGYESKDGSGLHGDRKENFDVALVGRDTLAQYEGEHNVIREFIHSSVHLAEVLCPLVIDFAQDIENIFGLENFTDEVRESSNAYFIRFIHYYGDREVGEETARSHTDQSGFTLHLYESDPGLQGLSYAREWRDVPVSSGETVLFPAMQLQLRSQNRIKAMCHRVIANEKTAREGRYSVVCFIQLKNTPKYNKAVHGRLQEKVPGFNYDISFGEFKELFK